MRSSFETMSKALDSTLLYDSKSKNLNAELMTYKMVLDEYKTKILKMCDECFIDTAQSYGLENREIVIGAIRDDLTIEKRRQMLKKRELINATCFTVPKIKEALLSFGLDFEIYEYPHLYELVLIAKKQYTKELANWIKAEVHKIMPAHLIVHAIFNGPSWEQIDENRLSFSYMDSCDMSWEEIDDLEQGG